MITGVCVGGVWSGGCCDGGGSVFQRWFGCVQEGRLSDQRNTHCGRGFTERHVLNLYFRDGFGVCYRRKGHAIRENCVGGVSRGGCYDGGSGAL